MQNQELIIRKSALVIEAINDLMDAQSGSGLSAGEAAEVFQRTLESMDAEESEGSQTNFEEFICWVDLM